MSEFNTTQARLEDAIKTANPCDNELKALDDELDRIRLKALASAKDQEVIARILEGYHLDLLDQLFWLIQTSADRSNPGVREDLQLRQMALGARNFSDKVEKYLDLKNRFLMEEAND